MGQGSNLIKANKANSPTLIIHTSLKPKLFFFHMDPKPILNNFNVILF